MRFQLTQQYGRGPQQTIGQYSELTEARKIMESKLLSDAQMKINTTYRIYEWEEFLIEEQNSMTWQTKAGEQASASGSRAGAGSTFSPTPLATAPRPAGMPPSAFKREDEKKDK